jgi:hypothetical protein
MEHYPGMIEDTADDASPGSFSGRDVLYREKGVSALDVQRAADALLRRGQKPSIATVRERLGGGSPNTLAPLLEQYWKALGARLPSGPESLERVPESLARMTEALWLRSLEEARERTKASLIGASPSQREAAALQGRVTELTAALAESRARSSDLEAQLLKGLRDRLELRERIQQLTELLHAEQQMRVHERSTDEARSREIQTIRSEILALARRPLMRRRSRTNVRTPPNAATKADDSKRKPNSSRLAGSKRPKTALRGIRKRR